MRNTRKDTLLLAAGVLGAFGAGLAAGRTIARVAGPGTTDTGLPAPACSTPSPSASRCSRPWWRRA